MFNDLNDIIIVNSYNFVGFYKIIQTHLDSARQNTPRICILSYGYIV